MMSCNVAKIVFLNGNKHLFENAERYFSYSSSFMSGRCKVVSLGMRRLARFAGCEWKGEVGPVCRVRVERGGWPGLLGTSGKGRLARFAGYEWKGEVGPVCWVQAERGGWPGLQGTSGKGRLARFAGNEGKGERPHPVTGCRAARRLDCVTPPLPCWRFRRVRRRRKNVLVRLAGASALCDASRELRKILATHRPAVCYGGRLACVREQIVVRATTGDCGTTASEVFVAGMDER
ncbi:hypothetical protein PR048_011502, partial [Dryococelus australis]